MFEKEPACSRPQATTLCAVAIFLLTLTSSASTSGPREKVLYTFQGDGGTLTDGSNPVSGLTADAAGNLYGTTLSGGANTACSCGTVFQLSPPISPGGAWTETVLYSFNGGDPDGETPASTLLFDKSGNLYGTTEGGGRAHSGTIFKLSPPATAGGAWTETVLYFFNGPRIHGGTPGPSLAMDPSGNLFGTALSGGTGTGCLSGASGCGVVFELHAPASPGGTWIQTVVSAFGASSDDIYWPSSLVLHKGVFYGTAATTGGGGAGGAVFQLVNDQGVWTRTTLHRFSLDGVQTPGVLTLDAAGNIFGTAAQGGENNCVGGGCGGVFELSPPSISGGIWSAATLYIFTGGDDGARPAGRVVFDQSGNLYGTTSYGGLDKNGTRNNGTVFELTPTTTSGARWTETTLYQFGSKPGDGSEARGGLLFFKGKFYGTTPFFEFGGSGGTVFSLTIVP